MSERAVCLDDFEALARAALPKNVFEMIRTGAGVERTLARNRAAFAKLLFRPRVLRDVSAVDLSTRVLGSKIDFPVGIAPSAMHCLVHPEGERATAAAASGTCMVLSSSSTTSMENVRAASGPHGILWLQLNILKDRDVTKGLVRRAEAAGFGALIVTVDDPVLGRRLSDVRHPLVLPAHLQLANFSGIEASQRPAAGATGAAGMWDSVNAMFDPAATWEYIRWLKGVTALPIAVKGVQTAADARAAADNGVAAIFVSNHGGRQLDSCPAAIEVLPEVVEAVRGRAVEVFVDGGVRTGEDVVKALLLGARAVFVGRPVLWALTAAGEAGVRAALEMLKEECRVTCALLGAPEIEELERSMLCRAASL